MLFTDIKTFTYVGNIVVVNGEDRVIASSLEHIIDAVQFHKGNNYLLEETDSGNIQVPFSKYQAILDEWNNSEVIEAPKTQTEIDAKNKQNALAHIMITTLNGNTFDGDDVARTDMLSAIIASDFMGLTEHSWKLADNSWKVIQLSELKEASALAIQAKGAILAQ